MTPTAIGYLGAIFYHHLQIAQISFEYRKQETGKHLTVLKVTSGFEGGRKALSMGGRASFSVVLSAPCSAQLPPPQGLGVSLAGSEVRAVSRTLPGH